MIVAINGKRESLGGERITVLELLRLRGVASPQTVAVQVNGSILDREAYASTLVRDNDCVEILYLMGGGS